MAGGSLPPNGVEALRAHIEAELAAGRLAVKPFYWDLRNEIIRPWETVPPQSRYFWAKWKPTLGWAYTDIIVDLRLLLAESRGSTEVVVSHEELAKRHGVSVATIERLLCPAAFRDPDRWFLRFFLRIVPRYQYDPVRRKKVRVSNAYEVAMDDPLLPEDEQVIQGRYTQEEIRALLRQGVVDLAKYASLRSSSPSPQLAGPTPQNVSGRGDLPLTRGGTDRAFCGVGGPTPQFEGQVQVADLLGGIRQPPPTPQLAVRDGSSSSSRSISTAADLDPALIDELLATFKGLSRAKAVHLIADCSVDAVRDQLAWFPHRDNTWATKGPLAAFIHYCRDGSPKPEAVEQEERRREEEARRRVEGESTRARMAAQKEETGRARAVRQAGSPYADLWTKLDAFLEMALGTAKYELWYAPLELADVRDDRVVWIAPNRFHRDFAETHCGDAMRAVLAQLLGGGVSVRIASHGEQLAIPMDGGADVCSAVPEGEGRGP